MCGSLPDSFGINKCDVFMCSAVNQVWELAVRLKKVLTGAENADISEASLSQLLPLSTFWHQGDFSPFFFLMGAERVKRVMS